jgi:hypothetical protein
MLVYIVIKPLDESSHVPLASPCATIWLSDLTVTVLEPILPPSAVLTAVAPLVSPVSVFLSVLVFAYVLIGPLWPSVATGPLEPMVRERSPILSCVRPGVLSVAMDLITRPGAFAERAVRPCVGARPQPLVVHKCPCELVSTCPLLDPLSMTLVCNKLAEKFEPLETVSVSSSPFSAVAIPNARICHSARVLEHSLPSRLVVDPLAVIGRAVRPDLHAMPMSKVTSHIPSVSIPPCRGGGRTRCLTLNTATCSPSKTYRGIHDLMH